MCRCLRVDPRGFYAWLKKPLSKKAVEDQRQTKLIKEAWEESGEVYGYRKLYDDLCDQGEVCNPNRVARVARLAGIKTHEGFSYLAFVIDLYSRRVVGWATHRCQYTDLALQALLMAVWRRKPVCKLLIH